MYVLNLIFSLVTLEYMTNILDLVCLKFLKLLKANLIFPMVNLLFSLVTL